MRNIFQRFLQSQTSAGATLFMAALFAIAVANTDSLAPLYQHWLHAPVGFVLDERIFAFSVAHLINDGLMAVFFLLVGLEIKRELLSGELSNRAAAVLPAIAAVGGMAAPAIIYSLFNWSNDDAMRGWAIPTATDIAFSLGVLALLGSRAPLSVKVFLTAVAIIDDLGAIAIIAFFYTASLNIGFLMFALLILFFLFLLNRRGVVSLLPYVVGFWLMWACLLQSGVHATLAGVAAAFTVPLKVDKGGNAASPLKTMEHKLHYPVAFIILPIFAFANAGVSFAGFSVASLAHPVPMGVALGLIFGKTIGISAAVWLAIKFKLSVMPRGCGWSGIIGIAALCGIGFTVSLFIGNLSFTDADMINTMKIGVLGGSFVAGTCGFLLLRFFVFNKQPLSNS